MEPGGDGRLRGGELALERSLGERWQRAFAAVERLVGGRVVEAERQPRWRPAWWLEVERDGERLPIYFRGDRGLGEGGAYRLEHELAVLQVLEANGIPVPHVHGFCEDPRGIVMERSPGRANLATAESEAERRSVLDHYLELLLAMHRIDPAAFEAVGLRRPKGPRALALDDLPLWEAGFRRAKSRPEPLIEFVLRWLHRQAPERSCPAGFVTGDSGQFLFEGGRVSAVIDLELAHLGDPLADLGALRSRDVSEPLGDLTWAVRRYGELAGEPVDLDVVRYHGVRFALNTPLAVAPLCAMPPPSLNLLQYMGWNSVYGRLAIAGIAELAGVELADPELPEPAATSLAPAHEALCAQLAEPARESYEVDSALRVALYLREVDRLGGPLAEADLDEAGALLGRRPAGRAEADAGLEALLAREGAERDAELLSFFHRRSLRDEALLRPALRELADARFHSL